jgi:hypothetical protein
VARLVRLSPHCPAALFTTLLLAALGVGSTSAADDPFRPSCSLGLQRADNTRAATFRVRCNFRVTTLTVDATRRITRFSDRLRLENPGPYDHRHRCARSTKSEIRCEHGSHWGLGHGGGAGAGVRIEGRLRFARDVCAKRKVGIAVAVEGGADCTPETENPCPAILYRDQMKRKRPTGC